jgi:hypothetical protein
MRYLDKLQTNAPSELSTFTFEEVVLKKIKAFSPGI